MLQPSQPVEGRRPDRFSPPHCPWPECSAHCDRRRFHYQRVGHYRRAVDPRRRVPRFRCKTCRRTFSRQSFACSYYLKRPELLEPVAAGLVAGSAHRQLARSLGCAPSTVTRLSARIGRHSLLFQALALDALPSLDEPVVLDHFETFVFSQDDRLGIATAVGQRSWFVYGIDPAPHRRAGKRSARKRARRGPLPEKIPGSYLLSTQRVLGLLKTVSGKTIEIVSDAHPAYAAATASGVADKTIRHRVYPNPPRSSGSDPAAARIRNGELFPVDLLHKIWRHSQAHHRRETIAFGRRSNAVLERAALLMVWRNFIKGVSERIPDPTTPGMRLGLVRAPLDWRQIFARRLFPERTRLPEGWMEIYRRLWVTPAVGRNLPHQLLHAF